MPIESKKIEEWKALIQDGGTFMVLDEGRRILATFGRASVEFSGESIAFVRRFSEIAQAVPALLAERESMLALLREVEWKGSSSGVTEYGGECPVCGANGPLIVTGPYPGEPRPAEPHAPDCRLAAFLRDK